VDALSGHRKEPFARADPDAGDVTRQLPEDRRPDRDRPHVAAALEGHDAERLAGEVDRVGREGDKLRHPDAGLPKDPEEEPVARALGRLDEPDDLVAGEIPRQLAPGDPADRAGDQGERA
jgi:hypothetical protein